MTSILGGIDQVLCKVFAEGAHKSIANGFYQQCAFLFTEFSAGCTFVELFIVHIGSAKVGDADREEVT